MPETVLTTLISSVTAIIICLVTQHFQNKKRKSDEEVEKALLKAQLASISRKLDEHNGYAEKIGGMAIDIAVIKSKVETLQKA